MWLTVLGVVGALVLVALMRVGYDRLNAWLDARERSGGSGDRHDRDLETAEPASLDEEQAEFVLETRAAGPLLSAAELRFYEVLERVLRHPSEPGGAPQLRVMCKVNLVDIVVPAKGMTRRNATITRNKLDRKHVDFVLVDPATFEPRVVVELDDRSHRRAEARDRDEVKDAALAGAGVRVVRVPVRAGYEDAAVAGLLRDAVR